MAPDFPFFQSSRPALVHLEIPTNPIRRRATTTPGRGAPLREVDRRQHGQSLIRRIEEINSELDEIQEERASQGLPLEVGLVLEMDTAPGYPLSSDQVHSLTTSSGISLLYARPGFNEDGSESTKILLHVPYGELSSLANKFREYAEGVTTLGNTPKPWVANIERISRAALKALWTDDTQMPEDNELHWWQFWVRRSTGNWTRFEHFANISGIRLKPERLNFPEHIVVVGQSRKSQLESSLDLLNTLAELRAARPAYIDLSDLGMDEQNEWIDYALSRIEYPDENAPAVCLLDSGVNRGHRLLAPILSSSDNHTIFPDGDTSDSCSGSGHGTLMAGLATYGDLRQLILTSGQWPLSHRLEGVKMFDLNRPHEPENYGAVTIQAVAMPEITAPNRKRVYSLSITDIGFNTGKPSAWSAAIDSLAFGSEEEEEPKRLIIVSAGNVDVFADEGNLGYPEENLRRPIQDPAQAWNALTVGAISHRDRVFETDPESSLLTPIATQGDLCPHTRTSLVWDSHWPIKPEIVMEGGNAAIHPQNGVERRESLDLLSTSASFLYRPIAPFRGTSAATALAARLTAQIRANYPMLRPETVRGMIIHSARWNDRMLSGLNPHQSGARDRVELLMRRFGFGEPDSARALASFQNEVTLFHEAQISPYTGSTGSATINDCHIHELRLPTSLLQSLGATTCRMRVTLSYFIAPNPTASNRIPGSRYRYAGALLRYRVKHKDESVDEFMRLVAQEAEEDGDLVNEVESLHDPSWALGPQLRNKSGSIIHDIWEGSAADLTQMDRIAVYPVKGWWAKKSFRDGPWHHCHRKPLRYSLIISIEADADIPLYTEISNLLSVPLDAT